jgi:ribosome-associated protein
VATKKTARVSAEKSTKKKAAAKPASAKAAPAKAAAPKKAPAKKAAPVKKAAPAKAAPVKEAPVKAAAKAAPAKAVAAKPAPAKAPPAAVAKPKPPKKAEPDPDAASKAVALACAEAGLDKKAVNVVILDVRGKVDYADYLVVMSGKSDRQVQALARGIAEDVQEKTKTKCLSVEALPGSSWVLMDFGDVVVHVFYDDVRGYYDLESLWMDARRIPVPGNVEAN